MLKTVKFGGSSLADAEHFRKAAAIIRAEEARRYVVVSAPGKRSTQDIKVTDLLYRCCEAMRQGYDYHESFRQIRTRYEDILRDLQLDISLDAEFDKIEADLLRDANADYAASRGEYLSAVVMAAYLGVPMIDAADYIRFLENGMLDSETTQALLSARLKDTPCAVVPGFYGSMPDGRVRTFSRGGSDITGSIVARASASDLYENWTDVSGLMSCDPRVVENPAIIESISYAELRELAYMGASVMHESAIFPVKAAGIPINIRNTNSPADPGTMILPNSQSHGSRTITGIAGRKDFSSIMIYKDQMNECVGFSLHVLEILARHGIQMEHMPTGIDIMSVIVPAAKLAPCRDEVLKELQEATQADSITVNDHMALLTVVGHGMKNRLGAAGRVFTTLGRSGVNVEMIDQGSGELNLIIGIAADDLDKAIRTLYYEFFGPDDMCF
ncbi:MAG: aspartate kinase [Clostridia bacterium]|nr:aspartate kinase [Clostridia bacterium]